MSARNPFSRLLDQARVSDEVQKWRHILTRKPNRGKKDDDQLIFKPQRWGRLDNEDFWVHPPQAEQVQFISKQVQLDLFKSALFQNVLRRQVGQGWGWVKQMLRYYARGNRGLHALLEEALIQIQSGQNDLFWIADDGTLDSSLPVTAFTQRNGRRPRREWTHMDVLDEDIAFEEAEAEEDFWEQDECNELGLTPEEAEEEEQKWKAQWDEYEPQWHAEWAAEKRLERELGHVILGQDNAFWQAMDGRPFSSHLDVLNAYADYMAMMLGPYTDHMAQVEADWYNDFYEDYYRRLYRDGNGPQYDHGHVADPFDDLSHSNEYDNWHVADPFDDPSYPQEEDDIIPSGYEEFEQAERERQYLLAHYRRELLAGRQPKTPDGKTVTDVIEGRVYTREDMEWYEQSLQNELRADHAWDIAARFGYQETDKPATSIGRANRRQHKPGRAKYGPQWAKHARRCDPSRHLDKRKRVA